MTQELTTSSPSEVFGGIWTLGTRAAVGFVFGLIILVGLVGNAIIITVIKREHKLHTRANYLIGSLAMADLLVSFLVSPFSAAMTLHEVSPDLNYVGHHILCQLFTFLDVTCCTASILHLCVIAHDRYIAVTKLQYRYKTEFRKILPRIVMIWMAAVLLSVAPYFAFPSLEVGETKQTSIKDGGVLIKNVTVATTTGSEMAAVQNEEFICIVNTNKVYRIVATTVAFYAPLVIIIVIYWRVARIAWTRIHHTVSATPTSGNQFKFPKTKLSNGKNLGSSHTTATAPPKRRKIKDFTLGLFRKKTLRFCCHNDWCMPNKELGDSFEEVIDTSNHSQLREEFYAKTKTNPRENDFGITVPKNNYSPPTLQKEALHNSIRQNSLRHTSRHKQHLHEAFCVLSLGLRHNAASVRRSSHGSVINQLSIDDSRCLKRSRSHCDIPTILITEVANAKELKRTRDKNDHMISNSKSEHSGLPYSLKNNRKDSIAYSIGNRSTRSSLRSTCSSFLRTPSQMRSGSSVFLHGASRRRITLHREKKIIRTMGMVIGAFVACWLPFFLKELIMPFCGEYCYLDPSVEVFINWLGYANSALNPFIYAFSNAEFNKAIRKLLRWCKHRQG